jgi:hypothetical protein
MAVYFSSTLNLASGRYLVAVSPMSQLSSASTYCSYGASKETSHRLCPQLIPDNSIVYRNPVYHQVLFATLMLVTAIRIHHLLRRSNASKRIPEEVKSSIATTFATGTGVFALGFFIWNLDNIFCTALTRQKIAIGWPVAFLLEGAFSHGYETCDAYLTPFRTCMVACAYCEPYGIRLMRG